MAVKCKIRLPIRRKLFLIFPPLQVLLSSVFGRLQLQLKFPPLGGARKAVRNGREGFRRRCKLAEPHPSPAPPRAALALAVAQGGNRTYPCFSKNLPNTYVVVTCKTVLPVNSWNFWPSSSQANLREEVLKIGNIPAILTGVGLVFQTAVGCHLKCSLYLNLKYHTMKFFLTALSLSMLLLLQSCGESMIKNSGAQAADPVDSAAAKPKAVQPVVTTNKVAESGADLTGYWVGRFEPDTAAGVIETGVYDAWDYSNKINVSIDKISGDSVMGHSVVAGNNRPFKGTVIKTGLTWQFAASEPGDDKYDGKFSFRITEGDSVIYGTWRANQKIRIPARKYVLTKKVFTYNPYAKMLDGKYVDWTRKKKLNLHDDDMGDYVDYSYFMTSSDVYKYNASADVLTTAQVANLTKADLFVLRNAIYARHGFSFKHQQLRAFFDRQPWYVPISTDIKSELTSLEKKNIALLLRYEKNAKAYYDVFGRG
jgi:hypothetical protein